MGAVETEKKWRSSEPTCYTEKYMQTRLVQSTGSDGDGLCNFTTTTHKKCALIVIRISRVAHAFSLQYNVRYTYHGPLGTPHLCDDAPVTFRVIRDGVRCSMSMYHGSDDNLVQ
jgi:hypothetical protein